jgi:transcriptional regulator with XRE-family HTH domain
MRGLRETLGLNQRAMALEFNVSHGAIAAWESGKRIPGPVLKLLELSISAEYPQGAGDDQSLVLGGCTRCWGSSRSKPNSGR